MPSPESPHDTRRHGTHALELLIALGLLPLLLFPPEWDTADRHWLWLTLCAPAVWLLSRIRSGHAWPASRLTMPVAGLLWLTLASSLTTFDIGFSLGKICGVLLGIIVFVAALRQMVTRDAARGPVLFAVGVALAGAGLALLGLLGASRESKWPLLAAALAQLPQITPGLPGAEEGFNPNAVSGCLVLLLPIQMALVTRPLRERLTGVSPVFAHWSVQALTWSAPLLTGGTLLLLQSRGALLGLAVATIAGLLWRITGRAWIAPMCVVVLTLGAGGVAWRSLHTSAAATGDELGIAGSTAVRVEAWSRAWEGIQDAPFTGFGLNTYRAIMPAVYPVFRFADRREIPHAHNQFLQVTWDLGMPGLLVYLWLWVAAGRSLAKALAGTHQARQHLAAAVGVGLCAHALFGLTDAIPLGAKLGLVFWLVLALAAALDPSPESTR